MLGVYAICGLDDFFVTTHVVAFAQDRGVGALLAGNLLALMGLTGLVGVVAAGFLSDRSGPVWPTALHSRARIGVFGWIMVDQSAALGRGVRAGVRRDVSRHGAAHGRVRARELRYRHLGALTGLITMVHQIFGGIGAYAGRRGVRRHRQRYDDAFAIMLVASALALLLTLMLRRPKLSPAA